MKNSALKGKEEKTAGREAYLESIIAAISDFLVVVDPDAALMLVNKAALDLLGYKEDELIGKPWKIIFPQEEESALQKYFKKIVFAGAAYTTGLAFLTKQGKSIPINFSGAVIQQGGKITGIVGVAKDMRRIMAVISDLEKKGKGLQERSENLTQMQRAMLHIMDDLEIAKKDAERAGDELKKANEELKRLRDNLEKEVEKKDPRDKAGPG